MAINLATGGAVKTAAGEAVTYAMGQSFGDRIQEVTTSVNHTVGGYVTDTDREVFSSYVELDQQNPSNCRVPHD